MSKSLPNIASPNLVFNLNKKSIEDLYYDGQTDPEEEFDKLSKVINKPKNRVILEKFYNKGSMDREGFRNFVLTSSGINGNVSDEIFSCITELYCDETDEDCLELPDCIMSKSEFACAFVRLANLWYMMNEGMANSSQLAMQTSSFLAQMQ